MFTKCLSLALLSTCSLIAHGQIAPMMVNQSGSPIQFVSVTSSLSDLMENVKVKNVSRQRVSSFQIGLLMSIPSPCATSSVYGDQRLFRVDKVNVGPGQEQATEHYLLYPSIINDFDTHGKARAVISQIAITSVTYSDGSTWQNTRSGHTYDDRQANAEATVLCSNDHASIDLRAKSKAACEAKRKGTLSLVGLGEPTTLGFDCAADTGYSCAVGGSGTSCTSAFCGADNPWCQNQICHAPGTPLPQPGGVKLDLKPKTTITQEVADVRNLGQPPSK
jgi:hypothetical protein